MPGRLLLDFIGGAATAAHNHANHEATGNDGVRCAGLMAITDAAGRTDEAAWWAGNAATHLDRARTEDQVRKAGGFRLF